MLPDTLRPIGFGDIRRESWESYRNRHMLPYEGPEIEFYRQVVYDHFDHFNQHYPWFDLTTATFEFHVSSVEEFTQKVRYFENRPIDWWYEQFDNYHTRNQNYCIYQQMIGEKTFPFPIIIMNCQNYKEQQWPVYGQPLHLVEGTHRLSYLLRMSQRGFVDQESSHRSVLIQPSVKNPLC